MEERTTYSRNKPITVEIIQRISEREERNALNLPPLYHSIDPDALDRLATSNEVHFEYFGYEITVENGRITIEK